MKKNILIYIPKLYHGGGAEQVSQDLANVLSEEYAVSFFTQHSGDIVLDNIFCLQQSENIFNKITAFLPTALFLRNYCKKNNIDIVISHMARANTITMLSKLIFKNKTKNILVTHNANSGRAIHKTWMKIWKYADKNVAVSHGSEYLLNKAGIQNTTTIYNAFNILSIKEKLEEKILPEHEKFFKSGDHIFLNIGRLHEQKGQLSLIKAFHGLLEKHPDSTLLLAGEGHLKKVLEKEISSRGLEKRVFLLGNVRNVFPLLRKSDCFVLSSNWEGLPTVLIEALISQKYIISTDCLSGPREILTDKPLGVSLEYPYKTNLGTLIPVPTHSESEFGEKFVESATLFLKNPIYPPAPITTKYSYYSAKRAWSHVLETGK